MKTVLRLTRSNITLPILLGALLAFLVSPYAAAQMSPNNKTSTRLKELLTEKGNVGGGGTTIDNQLANEHRIELAIKQSKWFLHYLLNDLYEYYYLTPKQFGQKFWQQEQKDILPVWPILFGKVNGKTVFERLKLAKVEIRQSEPCDYKSEHKEASADSANLIICFSISEILKKKHVNSEIEQKIVALYMHELTHLMGLEDEDLAKRFQKDIDSRFYKNISFIAMNWVVEELNTFTLDQLESIKTELARFSDLTATEKCVLTSFRLANLGDLIGIGDYKAKENLSINLFDPTTRGLLRAAVEVGDTAISACVRAKILYEKSNVFVPNETISIFEKMRRRRTLEIQEDKTLMQQVYMPAEIRVYETTMVTQTNFEDYDKLKRDLEQIQQLLQQAADRIKRYPRLNAGT